MTEECGGKIMESGAPTAKELAAVATVNDLAAYMRRLHQFEGKAPFK